MIYQRLFEIIHFILASPPSGIEKENNFIVGAMHGDIIKVKRWEKTLNGTIDNKLFMQYIQIASTAAAMDGYLDIVKYLSTIRPDFIIYSPLTFMVAAENNHIDILKFLSSLPSRRRAVPPSDKLNIAFQHAVENDHLDMVKFLASFPQVNPASDDNEALIDAISNDHPEIVKFLLSLTAVNKDPELDLKFVQWAAESDDYPQIKEIFENEIFVREGMIDVEKLSELRSMFTKDIADTIYLTVRNSLSPKHQKQYEIVVRNYK